MKKFLLLLVFLLPMTVFAENKTDVVKLSKCVDENSARFLLNKSEIKVKFIGIDAEEVITSSETDETNGSLVSDYVCSALTNAKEIKIEYEPQVEKEDKYGRIQAWVYVDGQLLQANLLELGYAKTFYLENDYLNADLLKEKENIAKENKVGLWQEEKPADTNVEEVNYDYHTIKPLDFVWATDPETNETNIFKIVLNFINEIFDKFLKFIDDLINDIL